MSMKQTRGDRSMKNTNKIYMVDGSKYQFSSVNFNAFINVKKFNGSQKGNKLTKAKITEELADKLHVSTDAIKNWLYGYNGPTDVEQVKAIGEYFDIDYLHLLQKVEDENMVNGINVSVSTEEMLPFGFEKKVGDYIETKRCIRNIYYKMLAYIRETRNCFQKYQMLEADKITKDTWDEEVDDNGRLKDLYCEIESEIDKCYLDLNFELQNEIKNYMWGVMFDYHDDVAVGKLIDVNTTDAEKKRFQERAEEMERYFEIGFYEDIAELFGDFMVN